MQASLVKLPVTSARAPLAGQDLLHFRVLQTTLCVPLACVVKVLALMQVRPVPGAPAHLRGLINLHDEPVALIDMAAWLRLDGDTPYHVDAPVLLCIHEGRHVALLIDEIFGIAGGESALAEVPDTVFARAPALRAALVHDGDLSLLVDLEQLLETL